MRTRARSAGRTGRPLLASGSRSGRAEERRQVRRRALPVGEVVLRSKGLEPDAEVAALGDGVDVEGKAGDAMGEGVVLALEGDAVTETPRVVQVEPDDVSPDGGVGGRAAGIVDDLRGDARGAHPSAGRIG